VSDYPERDLIRRLRRSAWLSGAELDDRADLYDGACLDFETRDRELSPEDHRHLAVMLEALLVCRRDYIPSLRLWMKSLGIGSRIAGRLLNTSQYNVNRWLRGELAKWPRAALRDRLDVVLTEWEKSTSRQEAA
jgi:hypothetical protein